MPISKALPRSCFMIVILIFAGIYLLAGPLEADTNIPDENMIDLLVGEMKSVPLPSQSNRINVGKSGIVDLFMADQKTLSIKGLAPGFTTLFISYSDGSMAEYGVNVQAESPQYIVRLSRQLQKNLRDFQGITVTAQGQKIMLAGTVATSEEEEYLDQLASLYSNIIINTTKMKTQQGTQIPAVPEKKLRKMEEEVKLEKESEMVHEEIERKDVVQIDVKVVQIRDQDSSALGIRWFSDGPWSIGGTGSAGVEFGKDRSKDRGSDTGDTASGNKNTTSRSIKYSAGINLESIAFELMALAENGKARFLATPKLIVQSGKTANFLVGGEIPIAQTTGLASTVDWKKYGTGMEISPIVIDDENIFINLKANLSELDWSNQVGNYPALITKEAETNVTARNGETFAIAGLVSQEETYGSYKVPVLGSIPVLGLLFRQKKKSYITTETIIFFTPHIIKAHGVHIQKAPVITPSEAMEEVLIEQADE